jgi:hypothetical protein
MRLEPGTLRTTDRFEACHLGSNQLTLRPTDNLKSVIDFQRFECAGVGEPSNGAKITVGTRKRGTEHHLAEMKVRCKYPRRTPDTVQIDLQGFGTR